ncbi:MAG: ABC transporter permease [Clostridia bacterium]|nr:ABC transporter permease [Clostridia bacterium]
MTDNINTVREPLIRIAKRGDIKRGKAVMLYTFSVLFAIVIGGIFISFIGVNPFRFYTEVFLGCFKSRIYFFGLIRTIMPLLITSIGISFAFKMKFWNIGAEGQFIIGAVCATAVGLFLADSLSHWLLITLMFVAGAVGGGVYGLITAVFKVQFGTNETLLTLMFNYIALYIVQYLTKVDGFRVEGSRPGIKVFSANAWLDQIGGIDITIIFCIVIVFAAFVYFRFTKHGYEVMIVGESQNTARYAGMNVKKIVLRTMFLSAAIIGVAGMFQASGSATGHQLTVGITGGVGWTAIIVAWLAKLNPFGILAVSVLMGILKKGSEVANSSLGVSTAVSDILQSIILFSVLAFDFFINYRVIIKPNKFTKNIKIALNKLGKNFKRCRPISADGTEIAVNNAYTDIEAKSYSVLLEDNLTVNNDNPSETQEEEK